MAIYDESHIGASTINNIEGSVFSEQLESFSRGKKNIKKLFKNIKLDGVSKQTIDKVKSYIKENDVDYYEVQILTELMAEDMTKNNFLRYQLEQLEKVARNWKPINRARLKDLIVQSETRLREGASVDDITDMVGDFFNNESAKGDENLMKSRGILETIQGYKKTQRLAREINTAIGEEIADIQATHIGISPQDLSTIEELLSASLDGRKIDLSEQNEQVKKALRGKIDSSGVSNVHKTIMSNSKKSTLKSALKSMSLENSNALRGIDSEGNRTGINLLKLMVEKLDSIDVTNKSSKEILEELNVDDDKLSKQQKDAIDRLTKEMKELLTPEQLSQADRLRMNQKEATRTLATTVSEKAQGLKGFSKPGSVFEAFAKLGGMAGNFLGSKIKDVASFLGDFAMDSFSNRPVRPTRKPKGKGIFNFLKRGAGNVARVVASGGSSLFSMGKEAMSAGISDLAKDGSDVLKAVKGESKLGKGLLSAVKLGGKLALPVSAVLSAWDAGSAAIDTEAIAKATGKRPEDVTFGDRAMAGVGGVVSGLANIGTGIWNAITPESMNVDEVKPGDITQGIERLTNMLQGNGSKTDAELRAEGKEGSSTLSKFMSITPWGAAANAAKGAWNWITGDNKSAKEKAEEKNADIKNLSDEEFAKKYSGMTKDRAVELENYKFPENKTYAINGKSVSREEYFDHPLIENHTERVSKAYLDQAFNRKDLTPDERNKIIENWKQMNANMEFSSIDEAKVRYEKMKQNLQAKSEDDGGFFETLKKTFAEIGVGISGAGTVVGPTTTNTDNSTVNNYNMQVPSQEVSLKALSMVSS
ncbi:hypothetical protein [Campylobacter jejuni]|uniref:Uncharacterized protein n=1 Tax=Campylobacter jejuni TaxID=197 RepID=A0A431EE90_CAMJU|nr:hypothetical protein [Campylobacter jejuni]RTJ79553.1 hypothetical protein C3H57_04080 [Campylobacter jejuni]